MVSIKKLFLVFFMGVWGCQTPIKNDDGKVYIAASFKTWQLADKLLWNYAPKRLRVYGANQDETGKKRRGRTNSIDNVHSIDSGRWPKCEDTQIMNSPPTWLVLQDSSYIDINVFTEILPLKRIAERCYSCEGKIYFIPGERHAVQKYDGLTNGHRPFQPNHPARFMTNENIDLSILTTNIFLLYQLYISDQVEMTERNGEYGFRWKMTAYQNSGSSNPCLRSFPESLKKDYPILSMIEHAEGKTMLPDISYEIRPTREAVLTTIDELRADEGTYYPRQELNTHIDYAASLIPGVLGNPESNAYIDAKKTSIRNIIRQEIWVVAPNRYFPYMRRDIQRKETDSVVRYEYFSFPTKVVEYYEKQQEIRVANPGGTLKQYRKAKLIYSR